MISNYIAFRYACHFYTWLKQDKEMEIDEVCRVIDALMHFDPIQAIKIVTIQSPLLMIQHHKLRGLSTDSP